MKNKKILFVGGPSDGYRKDDPRSNPSCPVTHTAFFDRQDWTTNVPDHLPVDPANYNAAGVVTFAYNIKKLIGENGKVFEVAFDAAIKDPVEALIKGYRYHKNKRPKRGMTTMARIRKYFTDYPPPAFLSVPSAPRYDVVGGKYVRKK